MTPSATMPLTWVDSEVVDTGWTIAPQRRDEVFVGFAAPDPGGESAEEGVAAGGASGDDPESGGVLEYSAIDGTGTVLWRAERPAACTGFAMSRADGRAIAVLTDADVIASAADGDRADGDDAAGERAAGDEPAQWQTTATAYDAATGDRLWGPVPVPGTVAGPGLVFGASAPAGTLGETGPRVALDAATGAIVADEREDPSLSVIGEYDGTVLLGQDERLRALDGASGSTLWDVPATATGAPVAVPGVDAPTGAALLDDGSGDGAVLLEVATGDILARRVDSAGYEPLSRTWVWTVDGVVSGMSVGHDPWSREIAGARIAVAGSGLIYLREGSAVHVLNAVTGRDAQAYLTAAGGGYAVPHAIAADGAALFSLDGDFVLATVEGA